MEGSWKNRLNFLLYICEMKYYKELWIATIELKYHLKLSETSSGKIQHIFWDSYLDRDLLSHLLYLVIVRNARL